MTTEEKKQQRLAIKQEIADYRFRPLAKIRDFFWACRCCP